MVDNKKETETKFVVVVQRLTLNNHYAIIRQLCENSFRLEEAEDEHKFIEWARVRYLNKVKEEYANDEEMRTLLSRIVWTDAFAK